MAVISEIQGKVSIFSRYSNWEVNSDLNWDGPSPATVKIISALINIITESYRYVSIHSICFGTDKQYRTLKKALKENVDGTFYSARRGRLKLLFLIISLLKVTWGAFVMRNRKSGIVIAYDTCFDTIVPAIVLTIFSKKKLILVAAESISKDRGADALNRAFSLLLERWYPFDLVVAFNSEIEQLFKARKKGKILFGLSECSAEKSYLETGGDRVLRFGFAGRIDHERGVFKIFDIADELNNAGENFEILVAGWGDKNSVSNFATELSKRGYQTGDIRFLGRLDPSEIQTRMRNAFFWLNLQGAERDFSKFSFPSKIIEGFSYGKLVVTVPNPNLKEIPKNTYIEVVEGGRWIKEVSHLVSAPDEIERRIRIQTVWIEENCSQNAWKHVLEQLW